MSEADTQIVVRGKWIVEYAVCSDGSMPAKEFFDALHDRDQAYLLVRFQLLANRSSAGISNEDLFRRERKLPADIEDAVGWLWAFKKKTKKRPGGGVGLIRISCFLFQNRWILTHGFWKPPKSKWPEGEYTRAFDIVRTVMAQERRKHN